jgi:hypothetical protein
LSPSNFEAALKYENPPLTSRTDVWKKQRKKRLEAKIVYGRLTRSLLSGCQAAYATTIPGPGWRVGKTSADSITAVAGLHGDEGCKLLQHGEGFSFFT